MKKAHLATDSAQIILRLIAISLLLGMIGILLPACSDTCETRTSYTAYHPVFMSLSDIRSEVASQAYQSIHQPGKIYVQGNWLLIVETGEGIHLIDNTDKRNPIQKSFLKIPGCYDLAVAGNYLYADSYVDLLTFDISNLAQPELIKRDEDVFQNRGTHQYYFINDSLVVDYISSIEEQVVSTDCSDDYGQVEPTIWVMEGFSTSGDVVAGGKGGSMARFAIQKGHLYALEAGKMQVFSLLNPASPKGVKEVQVGWDVETIFPHTDNLFLGSRSGMYIFDNTAPANPVQLSFYDHVNACDPVVVEDTVAYVTLRDGTECENFTNQLEVISIRDLSNPKLLATFPMEHPHGLGIDDDRLFICEGAYGLKVFDAEDIYAIGSNQLQHFTDINAYDVIPYQEVLIMIGENGIYQYSYSDIDAMELLSVISVAREKS